MNRMTGKERIALLIFVAVLILLAGLGLLAFRGAFVGLGAFFEKNIDYPALDLPLSSLQDEAGEFAWPHAAWGSNREHLEEELKMKEIRLTYTEAHAWAGIPQRCEIPWAHPNVTVSRPAEATHDPYGSGAQEKHYGGVSAVEIEMCRGGLCGVAYTIPYFSKEAMSTPGSPYMISGLTYDHNNKDFKTVLAVFLEELTQHYGEPDLAEELRTQSGDLRAEAGLQNRWVWYSESGETALCLSGFAAEKHAALTVSLGQIVE